MPPSMDSSASSAPATARMGLPAFRATCLAISVTYVPLAGSVLLRGPMTAMADYAVPPGTLASAHYADAMSWVFLHMTVLGTTIGVVGWFGEGIRLQRAFSRLMLGALLVYTFLDLRAADWALGSALYRGSASLGPAVVDVLALLLWARLSFVQAQPTRTA